MKIVLAIVVVTGIAIGLAVPVAKSPAPAAVAATGPPEDKPIDTVLERTGRGHFLAIADVNGEPIRFVVDTGADTVALTMGDARRAHIAFDPGRFDIVGRGAGGDVRGEEVRIDTIVLDGKRATNVSGVVLEGADVSLLGHTYLRRLSDVQIKGDQMILR